MQHDGHFPALEAPHELVHKGCEFFRTLRSA
jgi:hypothetical protein